MKVLQIWMSCDAHDTDELILVC